MEKGPKNSPPPPLNGSPLTMPGLGPAPPTKLPGLMFRKNQLRPSRSTWPTEVAGGEVAVCSWAVLLDVSVADGASL